MPKKRRVKGATPFERRFAVEYLIDLIGYQAFVRAGGKAKTRHSADQQASAMLKRPAVAVLVEEGMQARASRTEITQDKVLRELAVVSFSSIDDFELGADGRLRVRPGISPDAMRSISSIKLTTRFDPTVKRVRKARPGSANADAAKVTDVSIKLWDKPMGLKMAGAHVGLSAERSDQIVTGTVQAEVVRYEVPDNGRGPRGKQA